MRALESLDKDFGLIKYDTEFVAELGLKWSTKTGHRVRVFPVSIFRFVWG